MAIDRVRVNEQSTKVVEFDIVDQDDAAVPVASLSAATLTLVDLETYSPTVSPEDGVINSRNDQNVLNANNVTIDSAGHAIWTMQPEDNVVVTGRRQIERHRARFHFTWSGGDFRYELEVEVLNLRIGV